MPDVGLAHYERAPIVASGEVHAEAPAVVSEGALNRLRRLIFPPREATLAAELTGASRPQRGCLGGLWRGRSGTGFDTAGGVEGHGRGALSPRRRPRAERGRSRGLSGRRGGAAIDLRSRGDS